MGDIADYYMDLAMQQDVEYEAERHFRKEYIDKIEREYVLGILKWTTKFEGRIRVSKMTESHLENTIKFLKRKNNEVANKWIELLTIELEKR